MTSARMRPPRVRRTVRAQAPQETWLSPQDVLEAEIGLEVPDPITFATDPKWLDRPLYPRQATFVKVVFLREDLMTAYDYKVVRQWERRFIESGGKNGITPGVIGRMRALKEEGRRWFREVLLVMGRRAGKGYVAAICMSYILWCYMATGDPQRHYGIDRDKQLGITIYAGKRKQAADNLWGDLANQIKGGPCFGRFLPARPLTESLSVFAPADKVKIAKLASRGIYPTKLESQASFIIEPKESTPGSGRGPASMCLDPDTPVLKSDLTWVAIKDLQPGDRVVGVDEHPVEKGRNRALRDAEVEKIWWTRKSAVRLVFDDGSSVVCSPDHRWLVRDKGKGGVSKWRLSSSLTIGSEVRHLVDPWEFDDSRDGGYLAGMLDGEGCLPKIAARAGSDVMISQNPNVALDEVLRCLREKGFFPVPHGSGAYRKNDSYLCQQWGIRGTAENMRLLGSIRPPRLMQWSERAWDGVALRGGLSPRGREIGARRKIVAQIDLLPEQDLVDIQTSTRTFIANGLVSHNCLGFDEMAHVDANGPTRSAAEVYKAAKPALDQFGFDSFMIEPSSPADQTGQFYANYVHALEMGEGGKPEYQFMLVLQLESWDIYEDWRIAPQIPMLPEEFTGDLGEYETNDLPTFPVFKSAPQEYDLAMEKEEKSDPDTFSVERRAQWRAVQDAYLNREKVAAMFDEKRSMVTRGPLGFYYVAHVDPSLVNDRYAVSIGHLEDGPDGYQHVIFDRIHHWDPADWPDHMLDYTMVEAELWDMIQEFPVDYTTFDQYNSASAISNFTRKARAQRRPKAMIIKEETATAPHNHEVAETFKRALYQGWVHAPSYEVAQQELTFLQTKNGKVVHPDSGPVTHDDVARTMMEVTWRLLRNQVYAWLHGDEMPLLTGANQGGGRPFNLGEPSQRDQDTFGRFSGMMGEEPMTGGYGRGSGRVGGGPSWHRRGPGG